MAGKAGFRRDSKHRVLQRGESIRADGKYQFKYHVGGKPRFIYNWRLEPTACSLALINGGNEKI